MKLEDFIHQHRDAFDDREPSDKVWNQVASAVLPPRRRNLWDNVVIWRAAAILLLALSSYLLWNRVSIRQSQEVALKEFNDAEAFYTQQISDKEAMINDFQKSEGLNGFTHDFQQLEAMYLVLKEEMRTRPSKKVKDALVLNLLVRIDLLNQQLHRLEEGDEDADDKPADNTSKSETKAQV